MNLGTSVTSHGRDALTGFAMAWSRRRFVLTGLSLLAVGCTTPGRTTSGRPRPRWPDTPPPRPQPVGQAAASVPVASQLPQPVKPPPAATPLQAIPRSYWAKAGPIPKRLNTMDRYDRITIHHEGWTRVWFSDTASTARRLESIRRSHLNRLRAGDIGYHFVIDRAGRLWQGRALRYQGAHVRGHNPGNIGVMVLGNFNLQHPTAAQTAALHATLLALMGTFKVPAHRVHTHRELNPTTCPGNSLQHTITAWRGNGTLAS